MPPETEKREPSKSKRVRDLLRSNPNMRNKDIVDELAEFGVTAADVSNAKAQLKRRLTRERPQPLPLLPPENLAEETGSAISLTDLENTVVFIKSVGGLARATKLLSIVQQIQMIET